MLRPSADLELWDEAEHVERELRRGSYSYGHGALTLTLTPTRTKLYDISLVSR